MANKVSFYYTRFTSLDDNGNDKEGTVGYRIADDDGQDYNNTFDSFEELKNTVSVSNILEFLGENHFEFYLVVKGKGICFNDESYDYRELLQLQQKTENRD